MELGVNRVFVATLRMQARVAWYHGSSSRRVLPVCLYGEFRLEMEGLRWYFSVGSTMKSVVEMYQGLLWPQSHLIGYSKHQLSIATEYVFKVLT